MNHINRASGHLRRRDGERDPAAGADARPARSRATARDSAVRWSEHQSAPLPARIRRTTPVLTFRLTSV